jgi:hypothetical protein
MGARITSAVSPPSAPMASAATGVTDHGELTGLGDDDHPQYALHGETPPAHGHAPGDVTGGAIVEGDGRLTNARPPTAHGHDVYAALANGSTAIGFATANVVKLTPTAAATLTTTVPPAGVRCVLLILTTGTTSRVLTFGTGFKATGTLATGTTTARTFVITFVSDGTSCIECSRTAAMA